MVPTSAGCSPPGSVGGDYAAARLSNEYGPVQVAPLWENRPSSVP